MEEVIPKFFSDADVVRIVMYIGFIFPLGLIIVIWVIFNKALDKRNKRIEEEKKELSNLKDRMKPRSNGKTITHGKW